MLPRRPFRVDRSEVDANQLQTQVERVCFSHEPLRVKWRLHLPVLHRPLLRLTVLVCLATSLLLSTYKVLVDLATLQTASRVLHEQFASDAQIIPELGDTLNTRTFLQNPSFDAVNNGVQRQGRRRPRTVSLQMTLESHSRRENLWVYPMRSSNTTIASNHCILHGLSNPLPGASTNSHMGIIPEIERVWISIEHKLLLWDYTEGYVHLI